MFLCLSDNFTGLRNLSWYWTVCPCADANCNHSDICWWRMEWSHSSATGFSRTKWVALSSCVATFWVSKNITAWVTKVIEFCSSFLVSMERFRRQGPFIGDSYYQGYTFVVSLLPENSPQHSKGGEAHWKAALTAPTNNLQVAAWYYNQQCNEALIVLWVLSQAQSSQEPVEWPSLSISDCQSATTTIIAAAMPTTCTVCTPMWVEFHRIMGVILIFRSTLCVRVQSETPIWKSWVCHCVTQGVPSIKGGNQTLSGGWGGGRGKES